MSAPTRASWIQVIAYLILRISDGTCILVPRINRSIGRYLRTSPASKSRAWRWTHRGIWTVPLLVPIATGVIIVGAYRWTLAPVTLGWCVAAWHASRPEESETEESAAVEVEAEAESSVDEEEAGQDAEPTPDQPPVDPLLQLAADLIGTARGVHLSALLAALHRAGADPALDTRGLRAQLATRGVPVRPSVRAPREAVPGAPVAVSAGVHREDLEAVLGPLPDPSPQGLPDGVATAATGGLTRAVGDRSPSVATAAATAQPAV
jgi:hypothetical protein